MRVASILSGLATTRSFEEPTSSAGVVVQASGSGALCGEFDDPVEVARRDLGQFGEVERLAEQAVDSIDRPASRSCAMLCKWLEVDTSRKPSSGSPGSPPRA